MVDLVPVPDCLKIHRFGDVNVTQPSVVQRPSQDPAINSGNIGTNMGKTSTVAFYISFGFAVSRYHASVADQTQTGSHQ